MKTKQFLIAVVILCWPLASRAQNQILTKGISAYEGFEYQEALLLLEQALKVSSSTVQEKAKAHLYLGLVRFTLGDRQAADGEFKQAIVLDYSVALPSDTSPKIATRFEEIKKAIPPPKENPPVGGTGNGGTTGPGGGPPIIVKPPPPPRERKRIWTWVAAGVGGAALVGATVSGVLASKSKSDFDKAQWADEANAIKSDIQTRSLAANVLFGVGGAALVVALILFFVEDSGSDPAPSGAAEGPAAAPTRFTLSPLGVSAEFKF